MTQVVEAHQLTRKDFISSQEVRWCPGCGDYAILATVQRILPDLGIPRERFVWVSGIGCSSRFPYYLDTYGFHTIHGRAPAIATGIRAANPDLSVWIATGDGDGLSIGGNHLLHVLRRNLEVRILLFNNRIYGLTKGQYSPTSERGKVTKSSPFGTVDYPVEPASFAMGCGATFVARAIDVSANPLGAVLRRAATHHGAAFVEIMQNCVVFNDGAFDSFASKADAPDQQLHVEHARPLIYGRDRNKGLVFDPRSLMLRTVEIGVDGVTEADILVHDETNPFIGSLLARLPHPEFPVVLGVLHAASRPTYEDGLAAQRIRAEGNEIGPKTVQELLSSGRTWRVQ